MAQPFARHKLSTGQFVSGLSVAAGLAAQRFALLGEGLLECDARALGGADHFVACDLQQAAVHRVRDGFFLHRGVDDHALELSGLDGSDLDGRLDAGLEQLLQTFFTEVAPKSSDLRGVARQPMFVVGHAAEELPQHVLAPTRAQLFVAEIEAVLEVQRAGHQANRQLGPPRVAATGTHQGQPWGRTCHGLQGSGRREPDARISLPPTLRFDPRAVGSPVLPEDHSN